MNQKVLIKPEQKICFTGFIKPNDQNKWEFLNALGATLNDNSMKKFQFQVYGLSRQNKSD